MITYILSVPHYNSQHFELSNLGIRKNIQTESSLNRCLIESIYLLHDTCIITSREYRIASKTAGNSRAILIGSLRHIACLALLRAAGCLKECFGTFLGFTAIVSDMYPLLVCVCNGSGGEKADAGCLCRRAACCGHGNTIISKIVSSDLRAQAPLHLLFFGHPDLLFGSSLWTLDILRFKTNCV